MLVVITYELCNPMMKVIQMETGNRSQHVLFAA